jgi:hypothetical protein
MSDEPNPRVVANPRVVFEHSFIAYAESYGRAASVLARAVEEGAYLPYPVPIHMLSLHCIELSQKAVLIKGGMTPEEVRIQYGHHLEKLFTATPLDWSDLAVADIKFVSDALLSQALRYRQNKYVAMEAEDLLPFMEAVFQRCLNYVLPGAKRTVIPST